MFHSLTTSKHRRRHGWLIRAVPRTFDEEAFYHEYPRYRPHRGRHDIPAPLEDVSELPTSQQPYYPLLP